MNMRYLLFRLRELWENSPHADRRPASWILMTERSEAQEIVLRSRGVLPIPLDGDDPGGATTNFMRELFTEVKRMRRKKNKPIGIGGAVTRSPLPHHPACGSAPGGSRS
jgi:hypothetical protein